MLLQDLQQVVVFKTVIQRTLSKNAKITLFSKTVNFTAFILRGGKFGSFNSSIHQKPLQFSHSSVCAAVYLYAKKVAMTICLNAYL